MFSKRFKWSLESNRFARLIEEKKRSGARILDLTESNPTLAGFDYPAEEILGALAQAPAMLYEPAPRGLLVARAAVADYYAERGFNVDPEHVHLTASTSEAYSFLFKLLADQGQSVLVPQPSYPLFEFLAALEGVELRPYELQYAHPAGWRIDFDSVEDAVGSNSRAIILVSPNNPTGSFTKLREIEQLNAICARHDLALIADEVFGDYGFGHDESRAKSLVSNDSVLTFVMSGFSKILALPQMKLGWIVTNGPAGLREEAVERLDFIADTFLSVAAPVQHSARAWLRLRHSMQDQILARARGNLNWLREVTEESPLRLLSGEGGWYATLELPRQLTEEEWALSLLEKDDVLAHPGYFFDFPREAFLVLSLLPRAETFREAIDRILARVERV
ncbi:MAG TPA: pyridoxal phosphate-dependent aminotransferase [Blastocatellia bacterium]|nr:pyridoxal phosphate-dependent aminotransferase [Blastocatellia bacterium]